MRDYYAQGLSGERLDQVYAVAGPRVRQYLEAEIVFLSGALRPGDRLLELGCGCGRVLAPISKKCAAAWGVDNALDSLKAAARRHPNLYLAAMDAAALGFSTHSFDVVAGVQNFISACKLPPRRVLEEARRVARPGGRIILSSYAETFWPHRLEWFQQQAAAGLIGPIDASATAGGVIVCTDGFRATTFSPDDFSALAAASGLQACVTTVDDSSVFCEFKLPA